MSSQGSSPQLKMKSNFTSGSHEDLYRKAKSTISAGKNYYEDSFDIS